jgi:hypothetical protein
VLAGRQERGSFRGVKAITRLLFGLVSSLLLAAGFVRAAEKLDPLASNGLAVRSELRADTPAPMCEPPCIACNEN